MSSFQAILSDVHGNLEALLAVLEDAERQGVSEILSLGDLVGYGPNPRQVIRTAIDRFGWNLLGNHEEAVLFGPRGFSDKAEEAVLWTRQQLLSPRFPARESEVLWTYLQGLPRSFADGDVLYVHASPMDPQHEYLLPESSGNPALMRVLFERIPRVAFGGHTHMPGIFRPGAPFITQGRFEGPLDVSDGKTFVNVGSVGQPRDGDPRACYVLFDGPTVRFRRVAYDHRRTARKIRAIRPLPNALAARLGQGL